MKKKFKKSKKKVQNQNLPTNIPSCLSNLANSCARESAGFPFSSPSGSKSEYKNAIGSNSSDLQSVTFFKFFVENFIEFSKIFCSISFVARGSLGDFWAGFLRGERRSLCFSDISQKNIKFIFINKIQK